MPMKGQVLGTFATRLAVKAGVRQRQQAAGCITARRSNWDDTLSPLSA